jgi:hypothetical protein
VLGPQMLTTSRSRVLQRVADAFASHGPWTCDPSLSVLRTARRAWSLRGRFPTGTIPELRCVDYKAV